VLVGSAKLCGHPDRDGPLHGKLWMAAGFGVNVEVAPERADRVTSCLTACRAAPADGARAACARSISPSGRGCSSLLNDGFGSTREAAWLSHAAALGPRWNLTLFQGRIEGVMTGLAEDGRSYPEAAGWLGNPCSGGRNLGIG
jgi:biotin-(acetyl-CoA carboxylase) ligase